MRTSLDKIKPSAESDRRSSLRGRVSIKKRGDRVSKVVEDGPPGQSLKKPKNKSLVDILKEGGGIEPGARLSVDSN